MTTLVLPLPELTKGRFASLDAYTDEKLFSATGVRIAFTTRQGGFSQGCYGSLNLGHHVDDCLETVLHNRRVVQESFDCADAPLIVPNQVHGDALVNVRDAGQAESAQQLAAEGADGVLVGVPGVAALLCFADCVPVVMVSPTGRFAVVHAGWRGVDNLISVKAAKALAQADAAEVGQGAASQLNVYIGPHIGAECFETGEDVHSRFRQKFGDACVFDDTHIDLAAALRVQLEAIGVSADRICDLDKCTVCCNEEFFSYRAQGGVCGRHGAFAYRFPTCSEG